jgi:NADH:ubiquinone oxidoreductase subunit 5 (subunit L)/multisubunit Na+/H+ antiporter MnhA subunit
MKSDFQITVVCAMAILAAMTKRAQIPFSS